MAPLLVPPSTPPIRTSVAAPDAAQRLWTRASGDASTSEEVAAAATGMCAQLLTGLGRWIGADGYRALLERALAMVRENYPSLRDLTCLGADEPVPAAVVQAHGATDTKAGLVALVAALIELLGRIIGADIAVRLVEQIDMRTPRATVPNEAEGGRNG